MGSLESPRSCWKRARETRRTVELVWITCIVFSFALAIGLVFLIRFPEEVRSLIRRTESVQITREGIAWTIFEEAIRAKENRKPALEEISSELRQISRGRILWVDDAPANNRLETQALRALGVEIDTVTSNEEALRCAERRDYDLVLSDIGRAPPEESNAGLALPRLLRRTDQSPTIAYYTGRAESPETPSGQPVFDRPTQLLRFVAAVLD